MTNEEEKEKDEFIGELIFNKFKITKKIGQGSFGCIYESKSIHSNKLYAIKVEDMKNQQFILEEESLYLSYLNFPFVPKVKTFGYSGTFIILVMELLGVSLDKILLDLPSRKMSIRCVCNIAYQLLKIFELIHECHIVHRDIKPANIAIGRDEKSKYLYLLDFGLSKKYRSSKTKSHYPFVKKNKLVGNARYSSINALNGGSQSRRDDLESLGYLLVYFIKGRLPWQGHISNSKDDKYYKIKKIKAETTPEQLCQELPPQFEEYISYTRNLEYAEDPDYNYLRNLFLEVLKNFNWEFDYFYDWDLQGLTHSELKEKEKDKNEKNYITINNHKISVLFDKITDLKNERKKNEGIFENDKFVFDIEEESNFILDKIQKGVVNETDYDFYNSYPNSITPYANPKQRVKTSGCLPCQPRPYQDKDNNGCCTIY